MFQVRLVPFCETAASLAQQWFIQAPCCTPVLPPFLLLPCAPDSRWGPRTEWAEVFVIASEAGPIAWPEDYYGLYMGGEKIWIDNKRIDIKTYDPLTDPTGLGKGQHDSEWFTAVEL